MCGAWVPAKSIFSTDEVRIGMIMHRANVDVGDVNVPFVVGPPLRTR